MNIIDIRRAVPADVSAVLGLMRQLAEHEGFSEHLMLTHDALMQYCFATPARLEILVAVAEEGVVGYATYMAQLSPWAGREYLFIDDIYIVPGDPAGHGRAVARRD